MKYRDLRDFAAQLERQGELRRVADPVSPQLELTALADQVLRAGGPALWFERPTGHGTPVLANLFGTPRRVALGMGAADVSELREIGSLLARLKEPEPPQGLKDAGRLAQMMKAVWDMKPARRRDGPCRTRHRAGEPEDHLAADLELSEKPRHAVRHLDRAVEPHRRDHRGQFPDPGLRARRDRARSAGPRRGSGGHRRMRAYAVDLLCRQEPGLRF